MFSGKVSELNFYKNAIGKLKISIQGRSIPIGNLGWMIEDALHGTVFIFEGEKLIQK